ncbi:unnamed protein product, partial [Iphiclides podalirius]
MIYKGGNKKNLRDDPRVKMAAAGWFGVIKKRDVAAAGFNGRAELAEGGFRVGVLQFERPSAVREKLFLPIIM